jgi:hypothetical protein
VGGRFASEVACIELLEGGVNVVGVEPNTRRDARVGVDLDDAEYVSVEGLGPLIRPRPSATTEDKAFAAGRDGA